MFFCGATAEQHRTTPSKIKGTSSAIAIKSTHVNKSK